MFATRARTVPCITPAASFAALNTSVSPLFSIATVSPKRRETAPRGPLIDISPPARVTSTLAGSLIGIFPMRDMGAPSSHDAEHFAAHARGACLAVGHYTARSRNDCDPEPVHDARDIVLALVDSQSRLAHAFDLLDHRTAGVVLQRDLELASRLLADHREALDVTLVLQYLGDRHLDLGRGHLDRGLFRHLRIANARQHVGNRISHAHLSPHLPILVTSSPSRRRGSPLASRSRAACCVQARICGRRPADAPSARSDCATASDWNPWADFRACDAPSYGLRPRSS